MECCDNKIITSKNYENICINCGVIHDYQCINENLFIEGKNVYIICVCILKKLITT